MIIQKILTRRFSIEHIPFEDEPDRIVICNVEAGSVIVPPFIDVPIQEGAELLKLLRLVFEG